MSHGKKIRMKILFEDTPIADSEFSKVSEASAFFKKLKKKLE